MGFAVLSSTKVMQDFATKCRVLTWFLGLRFFLIGLSPETQNPKTLMSGSLGCRQGLGRSRA